MTDGLRDAKVKLALVLFKSPPACEKHQTDTARTRYRSFCEDCKDAVLIAALKMIQK